MFISCLIPFVFLAPYDDDSWKFAWVSETLTIASSSAAAWCLVDSNEEKLNPSISAIEQTRTVSLRWPSWKRQEEETIQIPKDERTRIVVIVEESRRGKDKKRLRLVDKNN